MEQERESTRNVLDAKGNYILTNYLKENTALFAHSPLREIAETASIDLDLVVTVSNVTTIKKAFDLQIGLPRPAPSNDVDDVAALREEVRQLKESLYRGAAALGAHLTDHG